MKDVKTDNHRILLIGIGNSGRNDDGLGWRFVETIEQSGYDFLDYEYRYQLQVEDAVLVSNYDVVIFVDASEENLCKGFEMRSCISADFYFFTTHAQIPGAILYLANHLYTSFPKAYTLAISGKEWGLKTSLSTEAERNLQSALSFFTGDFLPTLHPLVFSE